VQVAALQIGGGAPLANRVVGEDSNERTFGASGVSQRYSRDWGLVPISLNTIAQSGRADYSSRVRTLAQTEITHAGLVANTAAQAAVETIDRGPVTVVHTAPPGYKFTGTGCAFSIVRG
jgi:hypothetical protein